jgi:2-polyprenyl-3-methyl-5-hydroxy-6-metoxy-1,4-benzoquinol methylase
MSTELVRNCPVCRHTEFKPFLQCQDYTVSQEVFELSQCANCAFVFTNPRPTEDTIARYYQSDAYISHSNTRQGLIARLYHGVRKVAIRNKIKLINGQVPQKGKILDIGCGTGAFLKACQQNGWNVAGVEPDPKARKQAEEALGQSFSDSIWKLNSGESYQLITLWHVLEHVHRLEETWRWISAHVAAGGKILIAVPNHLSYDAQQFGQHWAAYDVPRHLYHFTQHTLSQLAKKHGFKLCATKPMPFDAYYVSMLSTQYRYGRVRYSEALQVGLRSNWNASRNGQYSSLIYIFEKEESGR